MIKILKGTLCCRIGEEEEEQPLVAFTPHPNMQFTSHYSNNQQQLPPEGRALTNLYSFSLSCRILHYIPQQLMMNLIRIERTRYKNTVPDNDPFCHPHMQHITTRGWWTWCCPPWKRVAK